MRADAATAATIDAWVAALSDERRALLAPLVDTIRANVPPGYEEALTWGSPCWQVPLSVYPDTYNKQPLMYVGVGAAKAHGALYLCNAYSLPDVRARFEAAWAAGGRKLDMGGACVRFKRPQDVDLAAVAEVVRATPMADYVAWERDLRARLKAEKKKPAR